MLKPFHGRTPLTIAVLLALALPATAQRPESSLPPLFDEVRVEVVNIDVVVTDKNGVPISGLTADDFKVLEDGEAREITNFFAFTDGRTDQPLQVTRVEEEVPQWGNETLRRRMAILFDLNTLEKRTRDAAIDQLEQFIREQFDGSYEWAVVAYGSQARLLEPFTSEKAVVIGALHRLKDIPIQTKQTRVTDQTFSEDDIVVTRVEPSRRRQAIDQVDSSQLTAQDFELRERMMQSIKSFDLTASAMVETMRAYAALPGRKSLVLVGGALEGLPSGPQLLGFGMPGVGSGEQVDPLIAVFNTEMQEKFSAIVKMANAAGFAIYPVATTNDLNSMAPQIDVGREQTRSFNTGVTPTLSSVDIENVPNILANGTGGVFYSNSRFFNAYDNIDHRTANAYVLGIRTNHAPDRKYHRLKVELKNSNYVVDSREGYLHLTQRERLMEELATPLFFPKEQGDINVEVQILPPEEAGRKKISLRVAGVVSINELTLVPQGEDMVGRVLLVAAIYDREGRLEKMVNEQQEMRFAAERLADFPEDAPARFALDLGDLKRGDYTVTLTVVDELTERFGTGLQPVQM